MPIVSMSVDEHVLRRFDGIIRSRGYSSRSEAFRDAIRGFLDAAAWSANDGENTLILSILSKKDAPRAGLLELQHRFPEIRTVLHTHLDDVNCLELIVARGPSQRLKDLIGRVRLMKSLKQVKFMNAVADL